MTDEIINGEAKQIPSENWHRIVGILMLKFGVIAMEILPEDVLRLGDGMTIVADVSDGRFIVRVMPEDIFKLYVEERGGQVV
jgi:hypothetical protein